MNPSRRSNPSHRRRPVPTLLVITGLLVPALALGNDEIVPLPQVQLSPDGAWQVRIESRAHADSTSAIAHWYQGNGQGEYRHITTAPLKNRVSPGLAYLSNTGALVTIGDRDEERQLMLAIYSSDGSLVKSWSLMFLFRSDYLACMLYKADEEREGESGVGPLYWLATSEQFSESADRLYIRDRLLGSLEVDTRSGEVKSLEGPCKLPLGEMTWELANLPRWKPIENSTFGVSREVVPHEGIRRHGSQVASSIRWNTPPRDALRTTDLPRCCRGGAV